MLINISLFNLKLMIIMLSRSEPGSPAVEFVGNTISGLLFLYNFHSSINEVVSHWFHSIHVSVSLSLLYSLEHADLWACLSFISRARFYLLKCYFRLAALRKLVHCRASQQSKWLISLPQSPHCLI